MFKQIGKKWLVTTSDPTHKLKNASFNLNGKKYDITVDADDTRYNYYKIGDRVRHHKGLNTYEKQNKTGDTIIFCNACASLNDIKEDYCFRCKCPLLK